jgi:hypothetical protein
LDILDGSTLLYGLAEPIAAPGYSQKAACLVGAAQAEPDSVGLKLQTAGLEDAHLIIAITRQALENAIWQQAWDAVYNMTPKTSPCVRLAGPLTVTE